MTDMLDGDFDFGVLILIVVEDGLVRYCSFSFRYHYCVLILFVVEDGLVHLVLTAKPLSIWLS